MDRARQAHANAVENLAVFAPLVLIVSVIGLSTSVTTAAAWTYVVARLVHYVIYAAGIPFVRTLAFLVGACSTVVIGIALFEHGL